MASGTHTEATPNLKQALAGFTGLVSPIATLHDVGLLHQTFTVEDGGARYILQRVNPVFSHRIHDNIAAVTHHLREHHVETIELVMAPNGAPYLNLDDGGIWRLMKRLPGRSFDRCPDVAHAREAGRHISSWQGALADFDAPLDPLGIPFHDTARHHDDLARALERQGDHRLHRDVAQLAERVAQADPEAREVPNVPRRIIHGDLKFNNLLFAEHESTPRVIGLIDLDTISRLPLCFDWGDAWRSWCNRSRDDDPEAALDLELFRAATEGLMETLTLDITREERDSLTWALELLSLELCVRFAADALNESYFAWDPARFASAGEHNLARARCQFSLYEQARDTHSERARFILS